MASVRGLVAQRWPSQTKRIKQEVEPRLPPPPMTIGPPDPMPTTAYHKAFMSARPSNFNGKEGPKRVEEWLKEVEMVFNIAEVPKRLKVRFSMYILMEDA